MNTQEIFNTCYTHLLTQNERAIISSPDYHDECKYRLGDLKCAVGILISDEHYSEGLEGSAIIVDEVQEAVQKSIGRELECREWDILERLQYIHDDGEPEKWKSHLDLLAQSLGFEIPKMESPE